MNMDTFTYEGKLWSRCRTTAGTNSFFHAVFGMKTDEGVYFDKRAKSRRLRWAAFLTYFEKDEMPASLVDTLTKCLSTNNKYKQVSIKDDDNFDQYVSDIMTGEQSVTKEEITILATLERVSIVLLNRKPDPFILVKPNPDILGSYQNVFEKVVEVVLCLEGTTFSRLEPLRTEPISKSENKIEKKTDPSKYRKGGNAGSKGVDYQLSLLALVILNALKLNLPQWKLSTENKDAGKFDDIVLEYSEGTILIQSKHKDNDKKIITLEELTSTNKNHSDFSLPKYFLWYQVMKAKFKVKNIIICTNAGVHKNGLKFLDQKEKNSDNVLYYKDGNYSTYTVNENILPDLKETTVRYYHQNIKNIEIDESVITNENLKEFLKHLVLYFNYPSLKSLTKIIKKLLPLTENHSNCQNKITPLEMYFKIKDWFQEEVGLYLTDINVKALFSEILSDKFCQKLEEYNVYFEENDLNFQCSKQVFLVTSKFGYILPVIKIYRTMHDNHVKILYVNPDDDIDTQKQVIESFRLPQYVYLVIICPKTEELSRMSMYGILKDVLETRRYKRIILVSEESKLAQQIGMSDVVHIDSPVTFKELSCASKDMILKKQNIIFQEKTVSLEDILESQTGQAYNNILKTEVLEEIIVQEQVRVGEPPLDLEENVKRYYINRTFKREAYTIEEEHNNEEMNVTNEMELSEYHKGQTIIEQINGNDKTLNDIKKEEFFSEDRIYNVNEKLIVIADSAGMGKTTVLIKLATIIKKNNPHLWVIGIQLNDYTKILREFVKKASKTISIKELLNSEHKTKLTNHLERCLFSSYKKVVLMLDGIDEISPDYTELILDLIKRSHEDSNFSKIFVTTRSHMVKELETVFNVKSFVLQPFTEENQVEFLTNYWVDNLQLTDEITKNKCKQYAKALINNVLWTNLENRGNHFASLPLHLKMTAEIFQQNTKSDKSTDWDGCNEYVTGNDVEPKFTQKMNVVKLYGLFIEKKQNIFIDKGNPTANPAANSALYEQFNECLVYHRSLALEVILGEDKLRYFPSYQRSDKNTETNLLKIGIVQKFGDNFHFVHRTFADYFLAEILHTELKQNENVEFQKFLIDTIFLSPQYNVTRIFLDSFLKKTVELLPSNIFEKYQFNIQDSSRKRCMLQAVLIHILAAEGCLTLLQLLLKCIDFKTVTDKEITVMDLYETEFDIVVQQNIFGNTLNILKYLTEQVGVNIKNKKGWNPLHCAALWGRTEMIKFLIECGANVNCKNNNGDTPIHIAIRNGKLQTAKYLVQQGSDGNIKNNYGNTCLHVAALFGELDILKFLIGSSLDFNITSNKKRTLLHLASEKGHFETVKFLLKLGVDCNIRDDSGCTALYLAVGFGYLDTVKLLAEYTDLNEINKIGMTVLHTAGVFGHLKIVKFLIKIGADYTITDPDGCTVLHLAARHGWLDVVKFLVEYGLDVKVTNNVGRTLLHSACTNGHLEIVKFLIELGADFKVTDKKGHSAFYLAVGFGHLDIIKFLVGRLETVKLLVEYDIDIIISNNAHRLLHLASARGHLELVKYLLELTDDCNIIDNNGYTALHMAARFGQLHVVKFLVEYGLDVNDTNKMARSVLDSANANGHLETVNFLLEVGAHSKTKDNKTYVVLQTFAAIWQQLLQIIFRLFPIRNFAHRTAME